MRPPRVLLAALALVVSAAAPALAGPPPYVLNRNADGSVTRWDPCAGPIHVRVNPGGQGSGAVSDARRALAGLGRATGLHLVYDGTTAFVPTRGNSLRQPADVVVAWAPPTRTDWYSRGAVGEGGWRSSGVSTDGGRTWAWKITQGFVVLDPGARLAPGFGRGLTRGALLLHELGHVAGLAHTSDARQVMYPVLSRRSPASWGRGDLAGLRRVGARAGCVRAG
ncbi:MAG: matrixin family metalloprotease [Nocardioidaceae bacterium]